METVGILFGGSLNAQAKPWLEALGKSDGERLRKLLELSQSSKIRLSDALTSLFPGDDIQAGLANLTRLRNRLNDVGEGLGLRFEADTKKKSPPEQREVWFTGPDAAILRATQFSKEVTADVEGRTFVPSKGIATTGSAMAAGKRLVRFFVSYAHGDSTLVQALTKELEIQFRPSKRYELTMWTDREILVGEKWNERILTAIRDCDFGLFMVSPGFLGSGYISANEIPPFVGAGERKPVIPVGVVPVSFDRHDLKGLQEQQIYFHRQRTFDHMRSSKEKREFAHELYLAIEKRLDACFRTGTVTLADGEDGETLGLQAGVAAVLPERPARRSAEDFERHMRLPEETRHFQRTKGFAHHLAQRESLDPVKASLGDARDALDELEAWALRADGSPFFALLGEVGIGKTTTLKQFTRLLIEKRQKEPGKKYPLPLYIDLRDYVGHTPGAVPTIEELLTSVIQRAWRVTDRTITAADLLRLVREENALIIFDGLDEKIVHLTQDRARDFIRTLWSVLPHAMLPRSGDVSSPPSSGKLLLSCRSHYFRDVWSQNAMLTGEDREGIDRSHYPAFCLLPFNEQQIKNYLTSFLGDEKRGSEAFNLIASIHNLRDLAERPYLLTLISGRLNELETLQMRGETVNAARLYDLVVKSWLSRDDGKHQLDPAHKRRLMEELAAALWRSGEKQWDVDRLEEWLDEFLHQNPAIASAYAGKNRSLLKEDLRTATFVLRPGTEDKSFRFAHTSLQEYFLAAYLVRALKDERDEHWNIPLVSREILNFIGQILAIEHSSAAMKSMERILGGDCLFAAYLAFQYWLEAINQNYPEPQPMYVNLHGANFDGQTIRGRDRERLLNLRGANLRGVRLNRSRVEFVDLAGADLQDLEARQALFIEVRAFGVKLINADVAGSQWRRGTLEGSYVKESNLEFAEFQSMPFLAQERSSKRRYLRENCLPMVYAGHHGSIKACAWSHAGTAFVSGAEDHTLKVWDTLSGRELLTLVGHKKSVTCCVWEPTGSRILSGSWDHTLKIWDVVTGKEVMSLDAASSVRCCSWSPDGRWILSGSGDNILTVWDAKSGRVAKKLIGHSDRIWCCGWSPDSKRAMSGSADATLGIWDVTRGEQLMRIIGHESDVECCAWSRDGLRLMSGSRDKTLRIWNSTNGVELLRLLSDESFYCCSWIHDDSRIVAGNWGALTIWDAATGQEKLNFPGDSSCVSSCAWSADGGRILSAGNGGLMKISDAVTGREIIVQKSYDASISSCIWGVDGRILSASEEALKIWGAARGQCLLSRNVHPNLMSCIEWNPDGRRVIVGADDNSLKLCDALTGEEIISLEGHHHHVSCVAWSFDGNRILSGSPDKTLRIWDAVTGREIACLFGHRDWVRCCAWSPEGDLVLSGAQDGSLKVWDAVTGKELVELGRYTKRIECCAWSPDGARVLSGAEDGMLRVWDVASKKDLMSIVGHSGDASCCAWSPDSTRMLSGGADNMLRVWDVTTGEELLKLVGHVQNVSDCAWSRDGSRILSGSWDNTIKVWDTETGRCLWTGHMLPENQSATTDGTGTQILHATPEAWRWLGWEERDAKGRFIRRLPAEVFGPIPGMED